MSLFQDAKIESAYLKLGIYGDAGSGKSYTASLIAIGLHKFIKAKKPIFFMDSETGSDYLKPLFDKAKIKLKVAKTRAFQDLLGNIDEVEKSASVFIVDSLTHFWDDLVESFKKKNKIKRMQIQNWGEVKPIWRDFSTKLIMSNLHFIVCGRAGDVWENVIDNEGYSEVKKTGTKMRLERETSYEPSLLVEMVKARENNQPGSGWTHRAWVVKDRFDVIDSSHFDNPTFESFLPHIELLNLGGEHKALEPDRDSQELFDNSNNGYERRRQKTILLEKIQEEIHIAYPGQSVDAKRGRSDLLNSYFNTRSWTEVEGFHFDKLSMGLSALEIHNSDDMKKQREELEEKKNKKEKKA